MQFRRTPFATIAVTGLGLFVAISVGVTLYMSGAASVRSTQALLAEQAETLLDGLERRIEGRLRPVSEQARWIASVVADGGIDLKRPDQLDAFVLGALGSTPEVIAIAILDPSGAVRRWSREQRAATAEDWSSRPDILDWLERGRTQSGSAWRPPLWAQAARVAVLLHDTPLHRDGRFVGLLAQAVPIAGLSLDLVEFALDAKVTPFILHAGDRVLAHPMFAGRESADATPATPLPGIAEIGDPVLARLRSPDVDAPFALRALPRSKAVAARVGNEHFIYIYRDMHGYGGAPWTLGMYRNPEQAGGTAEVRQILRSILAGVGVLVVAVLFAAIMGRRLSRPVQAFARAARAVREGRLDVPPLPRSAIAEFDDASRSFNQMVEGLRERELIRETLGRFVSEEVARGLLKGGGQLEPVEAEASVLVCDIEGFTPLTESLGPAGVVDFLNAYFEVMGTIIERHGGVITQFQGDAILAAFNVPIEDPAHAMNAVRAAVELVRAADEREFSGVRVRNRVGVCTGPLVAGAVGSRGRATYTVHGNVVNLAARLEALNKDYATRVLVSGDTAARCSGIGLRKVADTEVRGYREPVPVFTPL